MRHGHAAAGADRRVEALCNGPAHLLGQSGHREDLVAAALDGHRAAAGLAADDLRARCGDGLRGGRRAGGYGCRGLGLGLYLGRSARARAGPLPHGEAQGGAVAQRPCARRGTVGRAAHHRTQVAAPVRAQGRPAVVPGHAEVTGSARARAGPPPAKWPASAFDRSARACARPRCRQRCICPSKGAQSGAPVEDHLQALRVAEGHLVGLTCPAGRLGVGDQRVQRQPAVVHQRGDGH